MKIDKLLGWLLVIMGLVQVFQAIDIEARTPNRPGYVFAVVVSLLVVAGVFFLTRGGRAGAKS